MTSSFEKVGEAVKEAHSKENWNPLEFVKNGGVTLPTQDLDIFIDQAAAREHDLTVLELDEFDKAHAGEMAPPVEGSQLQEKIAQLRKQVWENRLVLHMRGVAPGWWEVIEAGFERERKALQKEHGKDADVSKVNHQENFELMRKSIRAVTHIASGNSSNAEFSLEEMEEFYNQLPDSQKMKVLDMARVLSFGVDLSDRFSDADFPDGSSDVAAEPEAAEGSEVSA